MGCVAVDDLRRGMVLSEDVRDIHSRLLLSRGQMINEKHLRILKIWGVCAVNVVGKPTGGKDTSVGADPGRLADGRQVLDTLFKFQNTDYETIHIVYEAAVAQRSNNGGPAPATNGPTAGEGMAPDIDAAAIRRRIADSRLKLPDAPAIISELNAVIADPYATSNDVARVVHKSPALAAQLLRIVNSAYYGFPSRIDRITRAVTIIGTKEISSLALGICVMRAFKDIPSDVIDMNAFIRHSLACGLIARMIAAQKNLAETEQLSVAGLLHDIGKLVLYKYYPAAMAAARTHAIATGGSVYQSEKTLLGVNHSRIAKQLLQQWKIPAALTDTIVCHHQPSTANDVAKASIVQMADVIANGLGFGTSGECAVPALDEPAWDHLGVPAPNMNLVIRQALHQMGALDIAVV